MHLRQLVHLPQAKSRTRWSCRFPRLAIDSARSAEVGGQFRLLALPDAAVAGFAPATPTSRVHFVGMPRDRTARSFTRLVQSRTPEDAPKHCETRVLVPPNCHRFTPGKSLCANM